MSLTHQSLAAFVPGLEQLVSQCEGKLAAIKPQIESALRLPAGRNEDDALA